MRLTPEEHLRVSEPSVCPDSTVYRLYLRGRYLRHRNTPDHFRRALDHVEKAVQRNPKFAPPYALLAQVHFMLWLFGVVARDAAARRVRRFVNEALRRDDRLPETYISLGLQLEFFDWDWTAAEGAFREALRFAPGRSLAHQEYGGLLGRIGRVDQAQAEIKRAMNLDPVSPTVQTLAAEILYYAGRYEDSAGECRNALKLDSSYVWTRVLLG